MKKICFFLIAFTSPSCMFGMHPQSTQQAATSAAGAAASASASSAPEKFPLHSAAVNKNPEVFRALIQKIPQTEIELVKALTQDLNEERHPLVPEWTVTGGSVLKCALKEGPIETVRLIGNTLGKKILLGTLNYDMSLFAAAGKNPDPSVAAFLLDLVPPKEIHHAIHARYAEDSLLESAACKNPNPDVLKTLFARMTPEEILADVILPDHRLHCSRGRSRDPEKSLLCRAIRNQVLPVIQVIWDQLPAGEGLKQLLLPNYQKELAIFDLICNKHPDVIHFIIGKIPPEQRNVFVNARNQFGYTPLQAAAFYGTVAAIPELIIAGADPDVKTEKGGTLCNIGGEGNALMKTEERSQLKLELAKIIKAALAEKEVLLRAQALARAVASTTSTATTTAVSTAASSLPAQSFSTPAFVLGGARTDASSTTTSASATSAGAATSVLQATSSQTTQIIPVAAAVVTTVLALSSASMSTSKFVR